MHRAAYLFLLSTMLLWGGNSVAGKLAVGHVSPMTLVFLRWVLAVLIMLPVGWRAFREDWPELRRHWRLIAGLGACGFTIFNVIFYTALNHTTAINVSILQAAIPIVIILANFALFRLHVQRLQIVGVALTIVGVAIIASHGDLSQLLRLDLNFGDAIMLVAVLCYSLYSVGLRLKPAIRWQSLMLALSLAALLTSLPFFVWEVAAGRVIAPDARGWTVAFYTALGASVVSQIFYIRGNELIGANRAGLFINLVPIFGTLLSVLIVGEQFQLYQGLALVLVLGGIALAEYSGRRAILQASPPPSLGMSSGSQR
ncbi:MULTISPECIES: DMT family transporter [unclassified Mesorhizobium]|uniref:DMT family transporter n=1 Tax=unclassified Mesorhizobium TaxID=325217 RepID=UPI000FCBC7DF|nr:MULTISPECIES: DMT family transporter [unclassified Mesorhizobium]TGP25092.1 DMT family transporter [Mesorhizobium sp. M1D.F.Ca.ET.231.01.1.1]TGP36415.1 DMT family transporter [Mesorhizobium sp. M1D.F.Ca.ET.234.01.1.1]TGS49919.1 DMT family transporter [Mesorhizobium sp. M1D.F.Ca.ET.184.01.1.1]TGS64630.1 DMT family transporter [Mesorhizobium sp. M1D.F.Ca.ET.183.01.1.1]